MKKYCAVFFVAGYIFLAISCGVTQKTAQTSGRGTKIEVEECEALAMDPSATNPRAFGNGISTNESFATNMALLDARSKMAQQIKANVNGMILKAEGQADGSNSVAVSTQGQTAGMSDNKSSYSAYAGQLQTVKWDQYVSGTKVLKKNIYLKEDGQYNVFVCIEMSEGQVTKLFNDLSQEKAISTKITEQMFHEGLRVLEIK